MIRFHLDESANGRLATALRRRGIEVTTPAEAGLLSAGDEQHLAFADRENRVLLTHDSDFLALHLAGASHAGIAYCPPGSRTLGWLHGPLPVLDARQLKARCVWAKYQ